MAAAAVVAVFVWIVAPPKPAPARHADAAITKWVRSGQPVPISSRPLTPTNCWVMTPSAATTSISCDLLNAPGTSIPHPVTPAAMTPAHGISESGTATFDAGHTIVVVASGRIIADVDMRSGRVKCHRVKRSEQPALEKIGVWGMYLALCAHRRKTW
jgi:hypothetical protein